MATNQMAAGAAATKRRINYSTWTPLAALIVLIIISALASPYFLAPRNLLNITRQISYTGIIALGLTLIIIAGGIDLSVGSLVGLAGGIAILALNAMGGGPLAVTVAILVALAVGALGGMLNGSLVTVGRVAPFIATLGTMSIFRSLTLYMANGGEFRSQSDLYPAVGSGLILEVPIATWVFLLLAILFHILLTYTPYGRHVCAVGANELVARYSAIRVYFVKFMTYVLTGLTVGVSAVLLSSRLNAVSSTECRRILRTGCHRRGGDRRHFHVGRYGHDLGYGDWGRRAGYHQQHAQHGRRLDLPPGPGQRHHHHCGRSCAI